MSHDNSKSIGAGPWPTICTANTTTVLVLTGIYTAVPAEEAGRVGRVLPGIDYLCTSDTSHRNIAKTYQRAPS